MNLYLMVEGDTEEKLYDFWLLCLVPRLVRVYNFDEVTENNYYIFNGHGYPEILNKIKNTLDDINNCKKYSHLLICLDCDELTMQEREKEIDQILAKNKKKIKVEVVKVLQNKCIETWLLGNRKVYLRYPQDEFRKHTEFFNVSEDNPEEMGKPSYFSESVSKYHYLYLRKMLRSKHMVYTKSNPKCVKNESYLNELVNRIENTDHISSFKIFYDFCLKISS